VKEKEKEHTDPLWPACRAVTNRRANLRASEDSMSTHLCPEEHRKHRLPLPRVSWQAPSDLPANALFAQARQGVTRCSPRAGREEARGAGAATAAIDDADDDDGGGGGGAGAAAAAAARAPFVTLACLPLVDYRAVSSAPDHSGNDLSLRQCGDLPTI